MPSTTPRKTTRRKLPAAVVVQMRYLHEHELLPYPEIARRLGAPYWTVAHICQYLRRTEVRAWHGKDTNPPKP